MQPPPPALTAAEPEGKSTSFMAEERDATRAEAEMAGMAQKYCDRGYLHMAAQEAA